MRFILTIGNKLVVITKNNPSNLAISNITLDNSYLVTYIKVFLLIRKYNILYLRILSLKKFNLIA